MDSIFLTKHYKVLELMYNNRVKLPTRTICVLSSSEIAEYMQLSKPTIHKICIELKKCGYITIFSRGKWTISEKAIRLVEDIQKIQ